MKLWAMKKAGLLSRIISSIWICTRRFTKLARIIAGDLFDQEPNALATLMLGGGVPKNYNLQPEPALGQILGIPNVRGYNFDVQIVSAPVTDGSLSSCPPGEAVTWGKVDKDTYLQSTESMQADYSTVMPFIVAALLENRKRYERARGGDWRWSSCLRRSRRPGGICGRGVDTGCLRIAKSYASG